MFRIVRPSSGSVETVTVTVETVTVTVMDGRNDLEWFGTIWIEVKISVTVTSWSHHVIR